ncbi:MAG: GAF domain-containing protein [Gemmatimonadota bacterium]|jgi:GAF domain-containing protein|nr:GAF domain-containing protein [Gemmatimonadota bacterium]MDP6802212.1 GAF domain-containing protein [Gemmatimonadota bacterium]MDP7032133.1 GAF domain-containing protein [Gemmatimonadota bacterium]
MAVLDDRLCVRSANRAMACLLGFDEPNQARGASLAEHPLIDILVDDGSDRTVGAVLTDLLDQGVGSVEVAAPAEGGPRVRIRAAAWDTEDPAYRRILLWVAEVPLKEPVPEASIGEETASRAKEGTPPPGQGRMGRSSKEEVAPVQDSLIEADAPAIRVVLLGAGDNEIPALRLLYRVRRMAIAMVFDPDAEAPGLSLAQDLGIPAISGNLSVTLETPPDAVVLARDGLEGSLDSLGLSAVPRVRRDDLEEFLVEPDPFLDRTCAAPEVLVESPPQELAAEDPLPAAPGEPAAEEPPSGEQPAKGPAPMDEVERLEAAAELLSDLARLGGQIVDMGIERIGASSGSLMLFDEEGEALRVVASRGLPPTVVQESRRLRGEGIAGRVADRGEPLLLTGQVADAAFDLDPDRPTIPSSVCVPVRTATGILGVLNFRSSPLAPDLDRGELEEAAALGRRAGPLLERALLLERAERGTREHSLEADLEAIAASGEGLALRLERMAERFASGLGTQSCAIYSLDPSGDRLVLRAAAGISAVPEGSVSAPVGTGLVGWAAAEDHAIVLAPAATGGGPAPFSAAAPLRHDGRVVGVVSVEGTAVDTFADESLQLLESAGTIPGRCIASSDSRS